MTTDPIGHLLLINIKHFENDLSKTRHGSEIDVDLLKSTFHGLGFQLYKGQAHIDLKHTEMKDLIQQFANDPIHETASCSAVIVMTHGGPNGILYASNFSTISISRDVLGVFSNEKAKGLTGKPKLFFFQSCRHVRA